MIDTKNSFKIPNSIKVTLAAGMAAGVAGKYEGLESLETLLIAVPVLLNSLDGGYDAYLGCNLYERMVKEPLKKTTKAANVIGIGIRDAAIYGTVAGLGYFIANDLKFKF